MRRRLVKMTLADRAARRSPGKVREILGRLDRGEITYTRALRELGCGAGEGT